MQAAGHVAELPRDGEAEDCLGVVRVRGRGVEYCGFEGHDFGQERIVALCLDYQYNVQ